MLPAGNVKAIDAYFFGASTSTESGLSTVDVKDLILYQQLYIYFIPIITNLGFINAFTVLVRLIWFRKHLKKVDSTQEEMHKGKEQSDEAYEPETREASLAPGAAHPRIIIDDSARPPRVETSGHVPRLQEVDQEISVVGEGGSVYDLRHRRTNASRTSLSMESVSNVAYVAKTMLILDPGSSEHRSESNPPGPRAQFPDDKLRLSRHVTIGRNSEFVGLTKKDWERIGGLEYRSLKLLVKIVFSYFFGLHLLGVIFLVGWIQYANPKYKEAVYSAQSMVDNLGFTLTPDSMISFRDAIWLMIAMSFLAFAGNTLYPVLLCLLIWTISKVAPKNASIQEPLSYLLNHPRRCYTLLFPSRPTWILFSIIFCFNFHLFAAIFQAASSRHTGTATFNLANVNPAVQFSLMVMMYIAIFFTVWSIFFEVTSA
ncbi:unnamed protein product [Clonostachys rhizophaga]|uniref:Uncharacterized protein n=1 Tax=Clonostachys rhizophaga TaxID=160324 RepID=A0A9N9VB31_9HYPO|nr:unnamed protein product [Clonostachys rhizophaga]